MIGRVKKRRLNYTPHFFFLFFRNTLFTDMRMSLSMYEVFNWNSSLDPSITNAKNKRASLSLPPTTDIFAIDDKSDSDTRRATMQRATSGEFPLMSDQMEPDASIREF